MLDDLFRTRSRSLRDFSSNDILAALGLERRHTMMDDAIPPAVAFVVGAAAGAGIALLLAPKSGRETRQDLSNKATELTNRLTSTANELTSRLTSSANELVQDVRNALPSSQQERRDAEATATRAIGSSSIGGTNRTS